MIFGQMNVKTGYDQYFTLLEKCAITPAELTMHTSCSS